MGGLGVRRRLYGAVAILVVAGGVVAGAPAAHAQKLYESVRYQSQNSLINNYKTYAANGTPVALDPNCPQFAGVRRWSKVWAAAYGGDESLHTNFRMQFHTTYDRSVADAELGVQNAGVTVNCTQLNSLADQPEWLVRYWTSCGYAKNQPTRWCQLAANNHNDPAVDPALYNRCPGPAPDGNYWPQAYHDWHNLKSQVGENAHLYNVDVLAELSSWFKSVGLSLNMPVYLDDVTVLGGVSNFDQVTAQPSTGSAWYGYGKTATPNGMNLVAMWYDAAAQTLGLNPIANPVSAHQAVDNAVAAGQQPKGWGITRAQLYNTWVCPSSPLVKDVVDPSGTATAAAIGQDLSGWVKAETGNTLCQQIQSITKYASIAPLVCNNAFVGQLFAVVDNNQCMNRPDNGVAVALGTDLGCSSAMHIARLFTKMKGFLGG